MGQALYVEQEVVHSAEAGKEVMIIFRDQTLANAPPYVFVTALEPNSAVTLYSGKGPATDSFTPTTSLIFSQVGEKGRETLPISGDTTDQVSVVRVDSGRVTITVVRTVSPQVSRVIVFPFGLRCALIA